MSKIRNLANELQNKNLKLTKLASERQSDYTSTQGP